MGAESEPTEPATATSSSRASSVASEKRKKLAPETEAALRTAVEALFQCKQQRALWDRVSQVHQEFKAREVA